ncbi:MAG: F0F1 ATP synthase subunit delta, partial [Patescibacteria group bacterium]
EGIVATKVISKEPLDTAILSKLKKIISKKSGKQVEIVTEQDETKILLKEILAVEFQGSIAERSGLIMRKQIVPLLKDVLEHS